MVRIGPSGWAYKDWDGIVYPAPKPRGFDRLSFLAQYFDAVEINTSFYGPPRSSSSAAWAKSVGDNPRFRFTAKLFQAFTHKRNASVQDEIDFKNGTAPLMESGRFGALLMQFPWSFRNTDENRAYIQRLHRMFAAFPLVLEVRHSTWEDQSAFKFLAEMDVGVCNIDQPLFSRSVRPAAEVTSPVGYVRLHGRNYQNWFSAKAQSHERYDYLYSSAELEPWVDRVRIIGERAKDVFVMSNNHHVGKAINSSFYLTAMLTGRRPAIPASMLDQYPDLRAIAAW